MTVGPGRRRGTPAGGQPAGVGGQPAGGCRVRRRGGARVRLVPVAVAVVVLTGAVAACGGGGDVPVSPLPVQPPASTTPTPGPPVPPTTSASPPSTAAGRPVVVPTSRRPTPATPTRTPTATGSPTGRPDSCQGAVRYDLVLAETELALVTSLCFATGAVLRIIGIGPGEVTVDREDLVSHSYEAGVVDVRFVRPGTVAVRIPQDGTTYSITVVVR
ncbi:hypothetical protein ACIBCR_05810 [Micromonospora echinospora]|uniref:hypothetical protein n=1 Tax=Micromonospora echinospora TaxID=1877 RepID=UPI003795B8EB